MEAEDDGWIGFEGETMCRSNKREAGACGWFRDDGFARRSLLKWVDNVGGSARAKQRPVYLKNPSQTKQRSSFLFSKQQIASFLDPKRQKKLAAVCVQHHKRADRPTMLHQYQQEGMYNG